MLRLQNFDFGEGAYARGVSGFPLGCSGFCALCDARDFGIAFRSVNHRNLAVGLYPGGAIPRFMIFNFGEGAFARRVLGVPLVPPGLCAFAPNVTLAIYVGLPARKRG